MADAPRVTVRIPGLLARFTSGDRRVTVTAVSVGASLQALLERYPALEPHLLDDRGRLRNHLTLVLNGTPVDEADADAVPLESGDEVVVLQAVSGG